MPRHRLLLPVNIASSRLSHQASQITEKNPVVSGSCKPNSVHSKCKHPPIPPPCTPVPMNTHTHESHTTPQRFAPKKQPGCWVQYNQQSAATRLALNSFLVCLLSCATIVHRRRTANPFVFSYDQLHNEIPSVAFMCVHISTISSYCCSSSKYFKRAELAHETLA